MEIVFYDVRSRQKVSVPQEHIKKTMYKRTTKDGGTQIRYGLKASFNGATLTKFVSQKEWESLSLPIEEPKAK